MAALWNFVWCFQIDKNETSWDCIPSIIGADWLQSFTLDTSFTTRSLVHVFLYLSFFHRIKQIKDKTRTLCFVIEIKGVYFLNLYSVVSVEYPFYFIHVGNSRMHFQDWYFLIDRVFLLPCFFLVNLLFFNLQCRLIVPKNPRSRLFASHSQNIEAPNERI